MINLMQEWIGGKTWWNVETLQADSFQELFGAPGHFFWWSDFFLFLFHATHRFIQELHSDHISKWTNLICPSLTSKKKIRPELLFLDVFNSSKCCNRRLDLKILQYRTRVLARERYKRLYFRIQRWILYNRTHRNNDCLGGNTWKNN